MTDWPWRNGKGLGVWRSGSSDSVVRDAVSDRQ